MINVDRQFNPDRSRILRDPDLGSGGQDENVIIFNQEFQLPEWPGMVNSVNLTTTERLDGIVLCSDHPNIVTNRKWITPSNASTRKLFFYVQLLHNLSYIKSHF
jgi:hypothetical protein